MNFPKVFLFIAIVAGSLANGQMSLRYRPNQWIGCYELQVTGAAKEREEIPRRFQLLWTRSRIDPHSFNIKALDLPDDSWFVSSWKVRYDSKLEINWATGYVSYRILLSGSGNESIGTAQWFTDTDLPGAKRPEWQVQVHQIACPSRAQK